ncbi:MAG: tetratricopeptide repeat protein [Planctomycetota bacterium]
MNMDSSYSTKAMEKRRIILAFMLLVILSFLSYGTTLYNDFVFDDVKMIKENTAIRSLSSAVQIITGIFSYNPIQGKETIIDPGYRPVRFLSYIIDYKLSGLSPVGYHLSNIIYHALTAFILFIIIRKLTSNYSASLIGALVFTVHPVNSEAVAYLTGRKDLLCTLFYLLAFYLFLKYKETPLVKYMIFIFISFLLALFSKEMAVTFPFAILLFGFLDSKAKGVKLSEWFKTLLKDYKLYCPLIIMAVLYSLFALLIKNPSVAAEEHIEYIGGSFLTSTLTMFRVFAFYIRILFVPSGLSADYSYNAFPSSASLFTPLTTFFSLLFLMAITALGILLIVKRKHLYGFAILFFFLSLAPVAQIIPLPEPVAERFLYLPSVSIALLSTLLFMKLVSVKKLYYFSCFGFSILLIVFSILTVKRGTEWRSTLTLFSSAVKVYPDCARAHYAVGAEHAAQAQEEEKKGRKTASRVDWESSLSALNRCLELLPPEKQTGWLRGIALNAQSMRGVAFLNLGQYKKAEKDFLFLLKEKDIFGDIIGEKTDYLDVHLNLAAVYLAQEKYEEARKEYSITIKLAEQAQKQFEQKKDLENAAKVQNRITVSYFKTAMAFAAENNLEKATESLKNASLFAGKTADAFGINLHLGLFLMEVKLWNEAENIFKQVISLCGNYETAPWEFTGTASAENTIAGVSDAKKWAYYRLAECLDKQKRTEEAIQSLRNALKIDSDFSLAHFSIGDIYYKLRKYDLAEIHFRDVNKSSPDYNRAQQYLEMIRIARASDVDKEPDIARAKSLLLAGKVNITKGETETALSCFNEVLNIISSLPQKENIHIIAADSRLNIGKVFYDKGDYAQAIVNLNKSVDLLLNTEDLRDKETILAHTHFLLANSYAIQNKKEDAVPEFEKSIALLSLLTENYEESLETAELLFMLGSAQFMISQLLEAKESLKKVIQVVPSYPGAYYQLARIQSSLEETKEAAEAYKKSIELGYRRVEANYELALIYLLEDDSIDSAIKHLCEVTFLTKNAQYLANAYQRLGLTYYTQSKYKESKEAYLKFLDYSDNEELKEQIRIKLDTDPNLK